MAHRDVSISWHRRSSYECGSRNGRRARSNARWQRLPLLRRLYLLNLVATLQQLNIRRDSIACLADCHTPCMQAGQCCPGTLLGRTGTWRLLDAAQLEDVYLLLACCSLRAAARGGAQASPIDDSIASQDQTVSSNSQLDCVNRVKDNHK